MQLTYELSTSIELNNWDVLFECEKEQKDIPSIHSGNCFRIIVLFYLSPGPANETTHLTTKHYYI